MNRSDLTPVQAEAFAWYCRKLRIERGWTQQELTRRSGVGSRQIAAIEKWRHAPRYSTVVRVAAAFGLPPHLMLEFPAATATRMIVAIKRTEATCNPGSR